MSLEGFAGSETPERLEIVVGGTPHMHLKTRLASIEATTSYTYKQMYTSFLVFMEPCK